MNKAFLGTLVIGLSALIGCQQADIAPVEAATAVGVAEPQAASTPANKAAPAVSLAAGTKIRVRLLETLDTQRNQAGDRFTATLDEPLVVGNRVVVSKGTSFAGHVTEAKPSGRFKGHAVLGLTLDTFQHNGRVYAIHSSAPMRASGSHKKRNLAMIGGGSGGGALIGAAAGGGMGALIGAGAGAAAGTAGAAFTGKKNIAIPSESELVFTLRSPVELRE